MTVLEVLADLYATTPQRILTVRNAKPETTARQVYFWYLHTWEHQTLRTIAAAFGFAEGTVRYGVRLVHARCRVTPDFRRMCRDLVRSQLMETA